MAAPVLHVSCRLRGSSPRGDSCRPPPRLGEGIKDGDSTPNSFADSYANPAPPRIPGNYWRASDTHWSFDGYDRYSRAKFSAVIAGRMRDCTRPRTPRKNTERLRRTGFPAFASN